MHLIQVGIGDKGVPVGWEAFHGVVINDPLPPGSDEVVAEATVHPQYELSARRSPVSSHSPPSI